MFKDKVNISDSKNRGQCFCGSIKFFVHGKTFWSDICHCKSCRVTSGAAVMAWVGFKKGQVEWKGTSRTEFSSSKNVLRSFCSKCGTSLSYSSDKFGDDNIFLSTTTFEYPEIFVPTEQVFTCESLSWMPLDNSIRKVETL